jgi:hypothetical protein
VKAGGVERITVASAPSSPNIVYAMATNPGGQLADPSAPPRAARPSARCVRRRSRSRTHSTVTSPASPQFFNTQGWYDQMLIVDPADPNHLYFGGALDTAEVSGAGNTADSARPEPATAWCRWLGRYNLPYVHADAHAAAYDAAGNLYFGTDGGIFKSTNNGATFTDTLNIGITTHLIYNLGPPRLLAGGGRLQDNGTRTRGPPAPSTTRPSAGTGSCDVKSSDATQVLGSQATRVYKSTDSGLHFTPSCSGITECGTASAPFYTKVVPWAGSASGDTVFTHSNTRVYKSVDYAGNWTPATPVPANTIRNIGVAQSNINILGAVTSGGHTYLSNNGGTS